MIRLICLLAVLRVASCLEQLPSRREIENSINRTIDEVERMLRSDTSLPRLSRTEIVDILFNITSTDMNSYEDSVERTRNNYQRALEVVLPRGVNDTSNESLRDLYTKAPLTKIIEDTSERPGARIETLEKLINAKTTVSKVSLDETRHYDNHRDTYAEVDGATSSSPEQALRSLLGNANKDEAPVKFSFDLENLEAPALRASTTSKADLEIVYGTSVTQRPATGFIGTSSLSDKDFRPTMPTVGSTGNILTSDQWRYNAPPSSTVVKTSAVPFLPTMMTEHATNRTISSTTKISEASTSSSLTRDHEDRDSPWAMENLRIVNENEKPAPLYVTPMSSTSSAELRSSPETVNYPGATKIPMREEVQDLLASIGLRPEHEKSKDSTWNKVQDEHEQLFGRNFQIPDSNNLVNDQTSGLTSVGAASPSISTQNTFELAPRDIRKGVDNLSPDVQMLFQRFGLQSSAKDRGNQATSVITEKPRVHTTRTSFWNNFKPVPDSRVRDKGMREFLAKFGLGTDPSRVEKSMKMRNKDDEREPSLIEAVPGNMKSILENIGLITRSQRPVETTMVPIAELSPPLHVFKPHETSFGNDKQRAKINELLDTVKLVQEGKADVLAVRKAAKELLETTKTLKNGPDPLSLEEILKLYNDDIKNEIKRQEDPEDLRSMAISEIANSTSTTSSSLEVSAMNAVANFSDTSGGAADSLAATIVSFNDPGGSGNLVDGAKTENSNLDALADSFGGSTAAPDPALPTPRKTGLYFLVDWNTFLEVGEEEKDKVNLRFQPKAGDRTRFLPVSVP